MPPVTTPPTEIAVILDRSGSMQSIAADAIGGFNAFLESQRREPHSEATHLTLILFDNEYEVPWKSIPLSEVPALTSTTFVPRGSTALRDAIGRTLSKMTRSFAARPAEQKPTHIVIAILTDGEENSSREYSAAHIADLIEAKKERGWQFVFLAANQDAIATASALRIDAADALNFTCNEAGTADAFMEMSAKVSEKRRK
jgi:uncharacterized protein YegL